MEDEMEENRAEKVAASRNACDLHDKSDEDDDDDGPTDKNSVGVERNVLKNGGVKKMVVKLGTEPSPQTPLFGDEVTVHYTGMLPDGTVFDTTRDKEPFTFKLGVGQVIKGWDKGVKTMRKGEQAIFTLTPEYAYGKEGQPPAIPPDTPLKFDIEILSWFSVKDVTRDGGVMKKIVREGSSWEIPKDADEITVKYEARLEDGTVVSKSPEEGLQYFIRDDGFGPEGREATVTEGAVPPNATLTVDLEVISWNSVETVTDDNLVVKKITRQGEGYEKPNEGSDVIVKFIGTLADGTIFEKKGHNSEEPFTVCIDEDQVIPGLDETFATMKKGELCIVSIPPEYGFEGEDKQCDLALVPANSTLTYEIEMVSFVKEKDSWDMDAPQKLVTAAKKKDQGNNLFKSGKMLHAAKKYEKGTRYVEYEAGFTDMDERISAKRLKRALKLNDAACKLKMKNFPDVVDLTTKVLESDSQNVKALFRRAQAYMAMMDLDVAEEDIKKALEIDPENRDVKLEQKRLIQTRAAHHKKKPSYMATCLND